MKRKLFFTIFCFMPSIMMAQSGYTIKGQITNLKQDAKVYLAMPINGKWQDIDSAEVKRGKFSLKGKVDAPTQSLLVLRHPDAGKGRTERDQIGFFLENSKISIKGKDSIQNAKVTGSVTDKEQNELEAKVRPLTNTIIRLNNEFRGKPKDEAYKAASDSVTWLVAEIKKIRTDFVIAHSNSYMGMYTYYTHVLDSKFDPVAAEPIYHQFSEELKNSALGKQALQKIESAKLRQTGVTITDFTQNDIHGKPFTLSSLRGKYVLIDFWASWCAPCRAENPHLVKAYEALKDKNFEVVGVSLDQSKPSWENAVKTDNLPWIHVSDLKGWKNEVSVLYGISSVPQNFLINPDGVIIGKNLRGDDLTEKLLLLIK